MSPEQIRRYFQGPDSEVDTFEVLRSVADVANESGQDALARELVLRALDQKQLFAGYEPILDSLSRLVGLYPYVDEAAAGITDLLAREAHRPYPESQLIFNRMQGEVFRLLLNGESVVLSAPTSFGKSRIVDELLLAKRYQNVVIVVPTIALIDETRRRLSQSGIRKKLVTQLGQRPAEENLFIFTAERLIAYADLPAIDFFVIDEFYKLDDLGAGEERAVALNQAFYRLLKQGGQFYLLGPSIGAIPTSAEREFQCRFLHTNFAAVASDVYRLPTGGNLDHALESLCRDIQGQTLVYVSSPKRAAHFASVLAAIGEGTGCADHGEEIEWLNEHFHEGWTFTDALSNGVGLHHGQLPRSLGQMVVRLFNESEIKFLVCTSTLIEGVNTSAKNVVMADRTIGQNQPIDFFTFNNIKGRSGRAFKHFVGSVYVFSDAPQEEFPFVDFPTITQGADVPNSLLIQIEEEDLTTKSKDRLAGFYEQSLLSISTLRLNSGVDPEDQVALASNLRERGAQDTRLLQWSGMPKWDELVYACELVWKYFHHEKKGQGVFSARQLAFRASDLARKQPIRTRIENELSNSQFPAKNVDEAIERILSFDRNWAGFRLPRYLMALSRISQEILGDDSIDYSWYCGGLERAFESASVVALEEFGLPTQIGVKVDQAMQLPDELDSVLQALSQRPAESFEMLSPFERRLLVYVQSGLGVRNEL